MEYHRRGAARPGDGHLLRDHGLRAVAHVARELVSACVEEDVRDPVGEREMERDVALAGYVGHLPDRDSGDVSLVYSIDSVRAELAAGNDDLAIWARRRPNGFFIMLSAATVPSLQATGIWANGAGYDPAAVTTFLQVADYYLVAQVHEQQYTVVTHEIVSPSTRRIKIPNACLGLGVRYITPFAMLRAEQARFVLTAPSPPTIAEAV